MPKIPISISNLQSRNIERINEPVESAGVGSDFQANATDFTPLTTTVVQRPKEEIIFEDVLPEVQRELIVKYDNNLTSVSNYSYVHQRDTAGNIVFNENDTSNQYVVIEPITYKFNTEFINKTIDTRFSYFQFPATTIDSVDSPEFARLNQELNDTFNTLIDLSRDQFAVAGETLISDVANSIRSVSDTDNAINLLTDAVDRAAFNDTATTVREIYNQDAG
jgi:hypothetical protein